MEEIFKDVPNYIGMYQVSNLGNVKSLNYKRSNTERLLKPGTNKKGYLDVRLKSKTFSVHKLVAITFLNHIPCGMNLVIDHINGIKKDNRVDNLQIITNRANLSKIKKNKTSFYVGVTWNKSMKKWRSCIVENKKNIHLGYFDCENLASEAYQKKLIEIEQKAKELRENEKI